MSEQQVKLPITALVAVKNEAVNIGKCIDSLRAFERIIVIDSNSSDATASIATGKRAEVVQFKWNGKYPKKRQWAMDTLDLTSPWIFLVDADEEASEVLCDEFRILTARTSESSPVAYAVKKEFCFLGKRFRFGGFSHSAVTLFRVGTVRFERLADNGFTDMDMEVHERVLVDGKIGRAKNSLIHHDFKGLQHYIDRHNKYSTWEAMVRHSTLATGSWGENANSARLFGDTQQQRRFLKQIAMRLPLEPWFWFFYHYCFRMGFFEGRRGLIAAQIRSQYISNVRAKMYEMKLAARPSNLPSTRKDSRSD